MSLCYRCEHRVNFLEDEKRRPRYECGDIKKSISGCYMFLPVIPPITKKEAGDKRPDFGPSMIAARRKFIGLPQKGRLETFKTEAGIIVYWTFEKE